MDGPLVDYYRAMCGRWRGAFSLKITDEDALGAAPIGAIDRLRARVTSSLSSLRMTTTVEVGTDVVHTTTITAFALPVFRSVERFTFHDGGRSASVQGDVWYPPIPWKAGDLGDGLVEVRDRGARYRFKLFGVMVTQTTEIERADALRVTQDFGFARGEVLLERVASTAPR